MTAPFLGAALDRGGKRKPLMAVLVVIVAICAYLLWWVKPNGEGFSATQAMFLLGTALLCYAYAELIHNSMLADTARPNAIPLVSGNGLALANISGFVIFSVIVVTLALPGVVSAPFIPNEPMFGIDRELHEQSRLSGPIASIWLLIFFDSIFPLCSR